MTEPEVLFEASTPLGFSVRVSRARWQLITTVKHPVMAGRESSVKTTLENPDEVRQSRIDPDVILFYKAKQRGAGSAPSRDRPMPTPSW